MVASYKLDTEKHFGRLCSGSAIKKMDVCVKWSSDVCVKWSSDLCAQGTFAGP